MIECLVMQEVPTFITGVVTKIEIDFCQDGAQFAIAGSNGSHRLKATSRKALKDLDDAVKSGATVTIAGYLRTSAECKYLLVYSVSPTESAARSAPAPTLSEAAAVTAIGSAPFPSIERAFEAAVKNLPPSDTNISDFLETIHLDAIWAEFGGIAGIHSVNVRVSRQKFTIG